MNKFSFSDLYKFITSLGIAMIALALLLPWYVSSFQSALMVGQDSLAELTPSSQSVIKFQQCHAEWIAHNYVLLFWVILLAGVGLLFYGVIQWQSRQKTEDKLRDGELFLQNAVTMDKEVKEERLKTEMEAVIYDNTDALKDIDLSEVSLSDVAKYIEIEGKVFQKLSDAYSLNYQVLQNIVVGDGEYDVIMKSRNSKRRDIILETKYIDYKVGLSSLKNMSTQFLFSASYYAKETKRHIIPILLLIVGDSDTYSNALELQRNEKKQENFELEHFRVIVVHEADLSKLEPKQLLEQEH